MLTSLFTGAGRLEQSHRLVRGGCVSSGAHRPAEGSCARCAVAEEFHPNEELWVEAGSYNWYNL